MSPEYTVSLRADQWELVVGALTEVDRRAGWERTDMTGADELCRKFTRRRVKEIVAVIQANVPEAA